MRPLQSIRLLCFIVDDFIKLKFFLLIRQWELSLRLGVNYHTFFNFQIENPCGKKVIGWLAG